MRIYNTKTRRKEEFKPIHEGKVGIYVCGPTVYDFIHIGNARPMIVFDTLRRYFEHKGYEVKYVTNFTDVDDKIIKRSIEEGIPASEVSEKYIAECKKDMEALGVAYEDAHPGLFIGNSYVMYPTAPEQKPYDGTNLETLKDDGWSVMVKLSSSAKPEGVWLRLPDSSLVDDGAPDESEVALHELGVDTFSRCKLLDARCIFPEAGNLMEQYDDPVELIIDGNNLGFLLDEQAQGMQEYVTKLVAAMEYEDCRTLKDVIGCADGIRRYSFLMADRLSEYARSELKKAGAPEMLIEAGLFDMVGFARDSLEQNGYRLDRTGSVYIKPREQEQRQEQDMPSMQQM